MSINSNPLRIGNFNSSEISALTKKGTREMTEEELKAHKLAFPGSKKKNTESWPGKAALTFIEECNMERRLGRSLTDETRAKATMWGTLLESIAHQKQGFDYILTSDVTLQHPLYPFWVGSPDGWRNIPESTVTEYKCPFTLKSFCQLVQPLYDGLTGMDSINKIRETHDKGEEYYWQMVSNSCLKGTDFAELIVYMPYESDIPAIKAMCEGDPDYYWLFYANQNELPFLKGDGYYNDLNTIRFEVPKEDKEYLTWCVQEASKMLIPFPPFVVLSEYNPEVQATIIT